MFLLLLPIVYGNAQTKRALLVAIEQYPEAGGWAKIHACNDIDLIQPVLNKQGFRTEDQLVLRNEQATRKAVDTAFTSLTQSAEEGDIIYVHFSCHGQQMADDDGDEVDGLDEALVMYDARRRFKADVYEGENHLRDDSLYEYLEALRKKIGSKGQILVVLDACHSGTGTRDIEEEYVRGTSYVFAPEGFRIQERQETETGLPHLPNKQAADILIVSACQPDEINYEYRSPENIYYGRLSYVVSKLMGQISSEISYMTFTKQLKRAMEESFAGRKIRQTPYFETSNERQIFRIGK